ncbi:MAG: histidine ammonia-lyase [Planctomycetota bacterium]|jgi:histidine ammonia-lyase
MTREPLALDGGPLTLADVESVARLGRPVRLAEDARRGIDSARAVVDAAADGNAPVYGVNTGFGSLAQVRIEPADVRAIQRNLVRSHAAGVGDPLSPDIVRATMLVLAASLCRGRSGVRAVVIERLLDLLNRGLTPIVPSRGSVGASGDLAPLAHVSLVLIGEGEAMFDERRMPGDEALAAAGIEPTTLQAKEGLALVNGTHLMTGLGALLIRDIERLQQSSLAATALAIDACRATDAFLDDRIHDARRHPGQRAVASSLRRLLEGSQILEDHRQHDPRVQDPYCLRASPQILGAAFGALEHVTSIFVRELGAVTDNPLVFPSAEDVDGGSIISGGNFHGMPLAIALDLVPIALCHIAGVAERRVNWLLTASDSENPVNLYLSPEPGLHNGLMIVQYAAAACCNELQTLAAPASVGNIPTSAGVEDYNSMGATAAHQAAAAVDLARSVVAIELLVMTEAMEYQRPLRSGAAIERIYEIVRGVVPRLTEDRPPSRDIQAITSLIRAGAFGDIIAGS